jgi:hypothetical protein
MKQVMRDEAAIEVVREWAMVGAIRAFRVLVDDVEVGRVQSGEQMSASITPGPHTVRVKMGRKMSGPVEIRPAAGDTVRLLCSAPGSSTGIQALLQPKQYLRLAKGPPI